MMTCRFTSLSNDVVKWEILQAKYTICPERLSNSTKDPSQDTQCLDRNLNPEPLGTGSMDVPLLQRAHFQIVLYCRNFILIQEAGLGVRITVSAHFSLNTNEASGFYCETNFLTRSLLPCDPRRTASAHP